MADRSVFVTLRASVGQYVAGMRQAADATDKVGKSSTATSDAMKGVGTVGMRIPPVLLTIGGAAAAAAGVAVKRFADFDAAMSNVEAATREGAEGMAALREAAMNAGRDTAFSAAEAAAGIESLAKAGVSTSDILRGGLTGALDLAAAGGMEVGAAADVAATAMTQFRLSGEKVPHIADLLAAAAGKAQGDVTDMAMALKQSGLVAAQMGLSLEDTTGSLAAFASAGLLGSDAGTSLRTMLLRLANPSKESAQTMAELGIAAYDAQGNFVGMANIAGQLQAALKPLPQAQRDAALATIFGSDAIRAANVLYQQGTAGIEKWTDAVDDQGFASDQAGIKMDNLKGDIERLMGSLDALAVSSAEGGDGLFRSLTQGLDGAVQNIDKGVEKLGGLESSVDRFWSKIIPGYDSFLEKQAESRASEMESIKTRDRASESNEKLAESTSATVGPMQALTGATGESTEASAAQMEVVADLRDEFFKTHNALLGLSDANIGFEQAVDDATASLEENKATLDINTQAGRDNRSALDNMAGSALRVQQQMYATGASQAEVSAKTDAMRGQLFNAARQFGLTEAEASAYVDQLLATPPDVVTRVVLTGVEQAIADAARVRNAYYNMARQAATSSAPAPLGGFRDGGLVGGYAAGGPVQRFPSGGSVFGAGGPRDDLVPAWLSNGEFVVNAAATRVNRGLLQAINAGQLVSPTAATTMVRAPGTSAERATVAPSITYGSVYVTNVDELMVKQRVAAQDAAAMAGLASIAAGV